MFGGTFSILHWIVVLAVVLLLFGGRGKVSAIMGDFGKGLRNFKTGLKGTEEDADAIEELPKAVEKKVATKKAASTLMRLTNSLISYQKYHQKKEARKSLIILVDLALFLIFQRTLRDLNLLHALMGLELKLRSQILLISMTQLELI